MQSNKAYYNKEEEKEYKESKALLIAHSKHQFAYFDYIL